ncbi:conjugal transfer protein [Criibacterium bergeronii]|uniref:conjugal transfer protein n=1 Tax=Criibacterium bergeronii TaxID=1871336 RepID=UPI001FAA1893|nr:conjugal transfer protein [Criibacterium bergeronii]
MLLNSPYLFFFYIGNIFSREVNSYTGGDFIDRTVAALSNISEMSYLPSFRVNDLLTGTIFSAIIWFAVYNKKKNAKKFRQGREYGSARWVA